MFESVSGGTERCPSFYFRFAERVDSGFFEIPRVICIKKTTPSFRVESLHQLETLEFV